VWNWFSFYRLFLVLLFAVKLDAEASLTKAVTLYQQGVVGTPRGSHSPAVAGGVLGAGLRQLLVLLGCVVWLPEQLLEQSVSSAGPHFAIDSANLETALLHSSTAPNPGPTAGVRSGAENVPGTNQSTTPLRSLSPLPGSSTVTGARLRHSPTLLGVLHFALTETAVAVLCVSVPLVGALLSEVSAAQGESGPSRSGRIYSPAGCGFLLLCAAVQCAVLTFAAGYMKYRRTISLELRQAQSAVSATAVPTAELLLRLLCAEIDCDARTVSTAVGSNLGRSAADLFASGATPASCSAAGDAAGAGGAGSGAGGGGAGSTNKQSGTGSGKSAGTNSGKATGESGKGQGKAPTTPTSSSGGANNAGQRTAGTSKASPGATAGTQGPGELRAQGAQGRALSYMCDRCLLVVLAVAALQLVLMLTGALDKVCTLPFILFLLNALDDPCSLLFVTTAVDCGGCGSGRGGAAGGGLAEDSPAYSPRSDRSDHRAGERTGSGGLDHNGTWTVITRSWAHPQENKRHRKKQFLVYAVHAM
jgi:hypothetical protein